MSSMFMPLFSCLMFTLLSWPHVALSIRVPDASRDIQEEQADALRPMHPKVSLKILGNQHQICSPLAVLGHTDEKLQVALGKEKPGGELGCVGQTGEREDLIAADETSAVDFLRHADPKPKQNSYNKV